MAAGSVSAEVCLIAEESRPVLAEFSDGLQPESEHVKNAVNIIKAAAKAAVLFFEDLFILCIFGIGSTSAFL